MWAPRTRAVHREVLALAWPLTIGMLSYTAMTVADSIFVGRLGTAPLAAMGLAVTASHLVFALPLGVIGGARVHVAQAVGAGDTDRADRVAWQALWLALGAGLLGAMLTPASGWMLGMLGADAILVDHGTGFLASRLLGAPALFVLFALQAWFQGRGDTRTPMVAAVIGNATNIALDPILIYGWWGAPELGTTGAGIATVAAFAVQAGVLALRAPALWARVVGFQRALARSVADTGLPMGTHALLDVLSYAVLASLLAGVGEDHVAAHVIVVRVLMVSFLPGMAIGEAAGVLVGQQLGARRPAAARRVWIAAMIQAAAFMAVLGAVFLLVPGPLIAAFGASDSVASVAMEVLALAALVQVFDAVAMVAVSALVGAGDTRYTMMLGLGAAWLVKVPVSAVAVLWLGLGAWGAWLGIAVELVVVAALATQRLRAGSWALPRAIPGAMATAAR